MTKDATSGKNPIVDEENIEKYLERIGLSEAPDVDLQGLTVLQRAHMATVPFENLDVVAGVEVRTDLDHSIPKIIDRQRGGWCFELNGAFAALLSTLGFSVIQLGGAVLLEGPNSVVDHLALEVTLDQPYLVDVGFGEGFISPLKLNQRGPQSDPAGVFEFIDSSQGITLTRHDSLGVPVPQYRFKRVHHDLADFDASSLRLRTNQALDWSNKPFATRLLDASVTGGPERVTLLSDKEKVHGGDTVTETPVADADWNSRLLDLFTMDSPL